MSRFLGVGIVPMATASSLAILGWRSSKEIQTPPGRQDPIEDHHSSYSISAQKQDRPWPSLFIHFHPSTQLRPVWHLNQLSHIKKKNIGHRTLSSPKPSFSAPGAMRSMWYAPTSAERRWSLLQASVAWFPWNQPTEESLFTSKEVLFWFSKPTSKKAGRSNPSEVENLPMWGSNKMEDSTTIFSP